MKSSKNGLSNLNFNTQNTEKIDFKDTNNMESIEEKQITKVKSVSIAQGQ